MGQPAAKEGDHIVAVDTHLTIQPTPAGPVTVPLPYPFDGVIDAETSEDVIINGSPAATVGSTATNQPPHIPQGTGFVNPPSNQGKIIMGSSSVYINKKAAARLGDTALTCNDPEDMPVGKVVAKSDVFIGG